MKFRRLIFITCITVALLLFADGLGVLADMGIMKKKPPSIKTEDNAEKQQNTNNTENTERPESTAKSEKTETERITPEESVNIIVLGLDEGGFRADVIFLLNYSVDKGRLNILSIPRDTKTIINGKPEKINALYAIGGEALLSARVKSMTGLTPDYYITLNFKGFREIINILGGVEFNVPINMHYDDPTQNLHIHLNKGIQILDGNKSESLVRFRKGNNNKEGYKDGDIGRINMQQEFIKAFIQQKLKLKYISKASDVFEILKQYMKTNIEVRDVKYYLKSVRNFKYDQIQAFTVPGDSAYQNKIWYFIYDNKKTLQLINDNFYK